MLIPLKYGKTVIDCSDHFEAFNKAYFPNHLLNFQIYRKFTYYTKRRPPLAYMTFELLSFKKMHNANRPYIL